MVMLPITVESEPLLHKSKTTLKVKLRTLFALLFVLITYQSLRAQAEIIIPQKEHSLITHLVKGASQPGAHSDGDVYLMVKIGKTAYVVGLLSGKVISQSMTDVAGGGICGDYAEVTLRLLDKDKNETAQGASQILKINMGKWKRIALSEGDYSCDKLKNIPRPVIKCLQVECN
jgi:hypothetical protein